MERKQLQQMVREQKEIRGFSYPFARLLADKLAELYSEDRVFEYGEEKAQEDEKRGCASTLTVMAESLVNHLMNQICIDGVKHTMSGIARFITSVNEFLEAFELEEEK